jgi:6-phosphogluconolactonase
VKSLAKLTKGVIIVAMTTLIGSAPVLAGTFVYVSNADDGDIGVYSVQTDGSLKPGEHAKAANVVMPMAVTVAFFTRRRAPSRIRFSSMRSTQTRAH